MKEGKRSGREEVRKITNIRRPKKGRKGRRKGIRWRRKEGEGRMRRKVKEG